MAIITKIEAQKRSKDRVNIYVDEEYFMAVYAELVYTHSLKKGMEIDKDSLESLLHDEIYMKAKNKALSILSKSDQSEKKLREKLLNDYDENIVEEVIEFLKGYKLINDNLLAEKIVHDNMNLSKFGKNKIKQNLYNKGIAASDIQDAISQIDPDEEYENAKYLAEKRLKRLKGEDKNKINQKIYQHLAYKGFSYDIIKRVLRELLNFDEFDC
ncbi:recombination regulator RecX [Peptacetobacter hiranonis]|uniref:Regulatory protein RecX n=1 Tax=Peptacetobacter hiranonis (strain DSM 13275 / JCM 10541 / KCTC 15199 / TO-931) TaxID=500633 RepID=B6G1H3_PEPHT|nr:recombination regulator RecX [Peptacetobacter hiranonis]EEA84357.1 regulatory protein RecX [Peptacetobacter hiranonis DSM 13275]QEK21434.1 Regulatory protein RecX [Peptacetobacter hiranonis]